MATFKDLGDSVILQVNEALHISESPSPDDDLEVMIELLSDAKDDLDKMIKEVDAELMFA
jgi:hypothetical protein